MQVGNMGSASVTPMLMTTVPWPGTFVDQPHRLSPSPVRLELPLVPIYRGRN